MTDSVPMVDSFDDVPDQIATMARDLAVAHGRLMTAGVPVSVSTLLVEVGRCPSCTRPLLRGDTVAYCTDCGSQVDQ